MVSISLGASAGLFQFKLRHIVLYKLVHQSSKNNIFQLSISISLNPFSIVGSKSITVWTLASTSMSLGRGSSHLVTSLF